MMDITQLSDEELFAALGNQPAGKQPLSVRNNNPGNMRPVGASAGFQGFDTPEAGLDAMRNDLLGKITGRSQAMNGKPATLANLISTWAPPTENNTVSYIDNVSKKTGIAPDTLLTAQDIDRLMPAMIEHEGGQSAVSYFGQPTQYADAGNVMNDATSVDAPDITQLSDEDLFKALGETAEQPEVTQAPDFMDRLQQDFAKRQGQAGNITNRALNGQQSAASTLLQTAGTGTGAMLDVAGNVIGSGARYVGDTLTNYFGQPAADAAKGYVQGAGNYVADSAFGRGAKYLIGEGAELAKQYPVTAANLGAAGNIASIVPVGRAAGLVANETGSVVSKTGQAIAKSGENIASKRTSDFAKELVMPKQTKKVLEDQVNRTSNPKGFFGKKDVTPDNFEQAAIDEVTQLKGVKRNNTFQENYNVIKTANSTEAKGLAEKLKNSKIIYNQAEFGTKLDDVLARIKANEPLVVGDAETTVTKMVDKMRELINKNPGTPSGLHKARQEFDQWALSRKRNLFDANDTAFSVSVKEVRKAANDFLADLVPDAQIKASLKKQSAFFEALDNIKPKAASEASTRFGRFADRIPAKNPLAKAAIGLGAVGLGGSAIGLAPGIVATGAALYGAKKLLTSPSLRKAAGFTLDKSGKLLRAGQPVTKADLESAFKKKKGIK